MQKSEETSRTKEVIDQEYTFHAAQAGHKAFLFEALPAEIKSHLARMKELAEESRKIPVAQATEAKAAS